MRQKIPTLVLTVILVLAVLSAAYLLLSSEEIANELARALGLAEKVPQCQNITQIVCNPPYIRVGAGCCLDQDGNSVCDKDEGCPKTTSTTSTSTSSTSTTSTVPPQVACRTNIDCGPEKEELFCLNDEIYLKQESPLCYKPGTTYARCVVKVSGISDVFGNPTPLERCSRGCTNGTCM